MEAQTKFDNFTKFPETLANPLPTLMQPKNKLLEELHAAAFVLLSLTR